MAFCYRHDPALQLLTQLVAGLGEGIYDAFQLWAVGGLMAYRSTSRNGKDTDIWLRDTGAIVLGKTVTTEFATTEPGPTVNPHNPAHTPGGSSSGSAAAVAAVSSARVSAFMGLSFPGVPWLTADSSGWRWSPACS